jgi:superfamily I DNA and/or RNA helicase
MVEEALKDGSVLDEFQIDETELTTTLFSRLAQGLPRSCQAMLDEQHRMVKPIGDLISECFYSGQLKSVGETNAPPIRGVFPLPVSWHDTSHLDDRFERQRSEQDPSFVNTAEARHAAKLLRTLDRHFAELGESPSVLVLAPYAAQVRELRRRVDQIGDLSAIEVEVATVDAVQGREADYVVFSVTRSNAQGNAGFLRIDARANVALSRAKSGLAIIGDMSFCRTTESPFQKVASYVSSNSDTCARVEVQ